MKTTMMQYVKAALESSSMHGLPRVVSNKPVYVRITWLAICLTMTALFIKGFVDFAIKLQSDIVTTSFEANEVEFQFPDVYACVENPISATFSATVNKSHREAIEKSLADAKEKIFQYKSSELGSAEAEAYAKHISFLFPQSLPYKLLVDALAHRTEQTVLESVAVYKADSGFPGLEWIAPKVFYDPLYLTCFMWNISVESQAKIVHGSHSAGLKLTLMTDTSRLSSLNSSIESNVFVNNALLPVNDWSLDLLSLLSPDRRSGVRVFLTPPGEYPTDFAMSLSLSPGKYHTIDIGMTKQSYKAGQFDCLGDHPDVQFLDPYNHAPYNHSYSYSYCYYREYHSQFQSSLNTSGQMSPLPWPLSGMGYLLNISSSIMDIYSSQDKSPLHNLANVDQKAIDRCKSKRPCSTLEYTARVSSVDWPSDSSLPAFINRSIRNAWSQARWRNLSTPALDFLMNENLQTAASYVRKNLLKVHLKPARALCPRVLFSRDYGLSQFISDIGGIMGIYLGMSLLTLCEVLELIFDIIVATRQTKATGRNQCPRLKSAEILCFEAPLNEDTFFNNENLSNIV